MFDKKIILLISFLLIAGSSHIFFRCIENNDDEVNFVDNPINEDTESSSSFLKYSILFIIVIIVAVILFFAIKRIVDKKKEGTENKEGTESKEEELKLIEDENIKKKIPKLKQDQNYPKEFNKYIEKKEELKDLIEKLSAKKDMKKITYVLIGQMKQYYLEKKEKKAKIIPNKNYADNYFLVDFYFGKEFRDEKDEGNIRPDDANINKDIFFRNEKRVRDISVFQPNYRCIIVNLFINFFEEFATFEEFKENTSVLKDENSLDQEFYVFMAVIIEPFLKYVSERKEKDVRFISLDSTLKSSFQDFCGMIYDIAKKENLNNIGDDIKKPDLLPIVHFIEIIVGEKLNVFITILDELINQYFPGIEL